MSVSGDVYSLQAASVKNKSTAQTYIERLKKKINLKENIPIWIHSVPLKNRQTVHRIMIGKFTKKSQARSVKKSIKAHGTQLILKKINIH